MSSPNLRGPIALSILAAILTIGMKAGAYFVTGSIGLFSDALESTVNLLAAVTAYFSLWYAARPADQNHTYGHEKIEFFSSGLEGVLVCLAGLGTAYVAIQHLITPEPLAQLGFGSGLALGASAINLVVARILLRIGRQHGSLVLEADGHHLMTDVWTSLAVVLGLGLVHVTGIRELDGLVAMLMGLHITGTGFMLVRRSFDGLMDHSLPAAVQDQLRVAIRAALPPGGDFHRLRTRQAGRRKFADFDLLVPGVWPVRDAHIAAEQIEERLKEAIPEVEVTIHIEPIDEEASFEQDQLARLGEESQPRPTMLPRPPIDD